MSVQSEGTSGTMSLDYSLDDSYNSHHSDLDMNLEVSPLAEQPGAGSENPTTDSHADISIRPHVETSGPTRILCQSSFFGRPADFTMTFEEMSAVPKTIEALAELDKKFIADSGSKDSNKGVDHTAPSSSLRQKRCWLSEEVSLRDGARSGPGATSAKEETEEMYRDIRRSDWRELFGPWLDEKEAPGDDKATEPEQLPKTLELFYDMLSDKMVTKLMDEAATKRSGIYLSGPKGASQGT